MKSDGESECALQGLSVKIGGKEFKKDGGEVSACGKATWG